MPRLIYFALLSWKEYYPRLKSALQKCYGALANNLMSKETSWCQIDVRCVILHQCEYFVVVLFIIASRNVHQSHVTLMTF